MQSVMIKFFAFLSHSFVSVIKNLQFFHNKIITIYSLLKEFARLTKLVGTETKSRRKNFSKF